MFWPGILLTVDDFLLQSGEQLRICHRSDCCAERFHGGNLIRIVHGTHFQTDNVVRRLDGVLGVGHVTIAELRERQNADAGVVNALLAHLFADRTVDNSVDNIRGAIHIREVEGHERLRELAERSERHRAHFKCARLQTADNLIGRAAKLAVHKELDLIFAVGALIDVINKLQDCTTVGGILYGGGFHGAVDTDNNRLAVCCRSGFGCGGVCFGGISFLSVGGRGSGFSCAAGERQNDQHSQEQSGSFLHNVFHNDLPKLCLYKCDQTWDRNYSTTAYSEAFSNACWEISLPMPGSSGISNRPLTGWGSYFVNPLLNFIRLLQ